LKLKLDENLGHRAQALLEAAGHDVATVHVENLSSASDDQVIQAKEAGKPIPPPSFKPAIYQVA
jgi:predicted nuclease of predicted toxin-antitoxin system